nr:RNA-directed DNA polymerase, eukaryota, reverse transcriptase zinc-binding domain protein [Tanacetum cinerariifolium]
VLANRLCTVLDDIVDEIQSAFLTDRQILDGAFILNEIIHWCKNKKKQSMIFKVDFEKAYDSVRWDFIDDILRRFGFGEKWCLFNRIKLDSSLRISHLFYGVDAIVMVQWSQCNIDTIIRVLDVFYRASGLRINMNKRNLMGISVTSSYEGASKYGIYSCVFFICTDVNSKKPSWVSWKSVLAAKDVGGLGMSSLFALNRALMFKWIWRFFSQKNSLWVRVVKAFHGEDGKIGKKVQPRRNSRGRAEQAQFEKLKEIVEGVTLSNSNDRWSWSLVGSGDFSV